MHKVWRAAAGTVVGGDRTAPADRRCQGPRFSGNVRVMTSKIYTKGGDSGQTGLYGGRRVSKDDPRVEAYGDVDELNATLGVVRTLPVDAGLDAGIDSLLATVQTLLFELGAELATPPEKRHKPMGVHAADVQDLERHIDALETELAPLQNFVLPGGSPVAAALHVARCVCRRAERRTVTLCATEPATDIVCVTFLNRLSDLLFVLARVANARVGRPDVPWQRRA